MRFKDLTDDNINFIKTTYHDKESGLSWEKRAINLGEHFNVSERTIRKWVSTKLNLKEKPDVEPEQYNIAKKRKYDKNKSRFLITWAQNNTPLHDKLFDKMVKYAEFHDADIHVIAGRYKNPTSQWTNNQENNEFWVDELLPYLDANRHNIHKYVSILSDVKIQPTATNPMTGLQGMSGVNSCIFGSPKVQLEMIPVLEGNKPKMMLTTGAITKKNYTDSKAGKKGEFHHTYGFVFVEIEDKDTFHVRQITADDKTGDFTDLCYKVTDKGVEKIDNIEAIILGDLHYGHHDEDVLNSTIELMDELEPKHVILHDVFDGYSINHHESKDPFIQYSKEVNGLNDLGKEVDQMLDGLSIFKKFKNVVVVRSNHDDFLDRWLKNDDWKKQASFKNSALYMRYSSILLEQYATDSHSVKGVIPTLINERYPKFITLSRNSSYRVKGFELGQHGDIGSNGSRGSLLNYRKLNTKIIVGHYHTPERKDGALSVGTSTKLRVGYNRGPSSWLQSHVIIHSDGRAQHINFIKNKKGKITFSTLL